MKYIDTHAHVNFAAYDEDRDEVMKRTLEGETVVINVGTKQATSKQAIDIAHKYGEGVYAIVGLHPVHTEKSFHDEQELGEGSGGGFTSSGEVFDYDFYKNLAQDDKVVAIGECGLDYFRLGEESKEKQMKAFVEQIKLANEVNKPLMLHIRPGKEGDAYGDAIELLKAHAKIKGTAHFFAGTPEHAQAFFDLGFYVSFGGVITFAKDYEEVVKYAPIDRILSETDCPYVTPVPYRGKRNEPLYVREVVKKIADLKGLSPQEVEEQLMENAQALFGIK